MRSNHLLRSLLLVLVILPGLNPELRAADEDPVVLLWKLLAADSRGDPSVRMELAGQNAFITDEKGTKLTQQHGPIFELDADPLVVSSHWKLSANDLACTRNACVIRVQFCAIGRSVGFGSPSWEKNSEREFQSLPKPQVINVTYRFLRSGGQWKLVKLPLPFVHPEALHSFFQKEIENEEAQKQLKLEDPRARRNMEAMHNWRERQLHLISEMLEGNSLPE